MEQQNKKYRVVVSARAAQMLVSHAAFLAQASTAAAQLAGIHAPALPMADRGLYPTKHIPLYLIRKAVHAHFPNHGKHGLCRLCGGLSAGLRLAPPQINKKTVASAKLQRVTVF